MAKQFQFRRGTTSAHSTFTGAVGEMTVDTDKNTVVVHDGSSVGGFPLPTAGHVNITDFGTVGDGVTDDTAAVDAAFAAAEGKTLLLRKGDVYKVTTSIKVRDDTTVFGAGAEILFVITGATKCLDVRSRTRVYDLKVTCLGSAVGGDGTFHVPVVLGESISSGGVPFTVQDVILENLILEGNRSIGTNMVLIGDISNVRIRNISWPATSTTGIGILIHWSGETAPDDQVTHPHNISIDGVVCEGLNSGDSTSSVIFLSTPYAVSIKNVFAKNCDRLLNLSTGTFGNSKSTAETKDSVLYGLSMSDCVGVNCAAGFSIVDVGLDYTEDFQFMISNCRFSGDGTGTGADINKCSQGMVINCHFENYNQGFRFHVGSSNLDVLHTTIKDIGSAGISCSASVNGHKIIGCIIEDVNQNLNSTTDTSSLIEIEGDDWVIRDCRLGLAAGENARWGIAYTTGARLRVDNVNIRDIDAIGTMFVNAGTEAVVTALYPSDTTLTESGNEIFETNIPAAFRFHKNNINQTGLVSSATTKITWATAAVDVTGWADLANDRFTVERSGVYAIGATVVVRGMGDDKVAISYLYVNGSKVVILDNESTSGAGLNIGLSGSTIVSLSKDDYVEIFVFHNHGGPKDIDGSIVDGSNFWGYKVA